MQKNYPTKRDFPYSFYFNLNAHRGSKNCPGASRMSKIDEKYDQLRLGYTMKFSIGG